MNRLLSNIARNYHSLAKPNVQKGSGLGLSFVKEIAMLHKAEINVENNDGEGTKMTMVLPSANE
ncbi:MAG: ATP-binding protein [Gammaproteobacteria bacterium]